MNLVDILASMPRRHGAGRPDVIRRSSGKWDARTVVSLKPQGAVCAVPCGVQHMRHAAEGSAMNYIDLFAMGVILYIYLRMSAEVLRKA
jgi:hypothetical protein